MLTGIELSDLPADELKKILEDAGYKIRIIVERDDGIDFNKTDEIVVKSIVESYEQDDGRYIN